MSSPATWKKILVPTDFSDESLDAMFQARSLQQSSPVEVVLLHVTEPAYEGLRIQTTEIHQRIDEAAQQQLEALAQEHFPGSSHVTAMVKEGRAGDAICETARTLGVDAILIAPHGLAGARHFTLGSVTDKVVRHAPCSVLVVR